MEFACLMVGSMQENAYIYWDEFTKNAVIIDPGFEPKKIIEFAKQKELFVQAILLTHGHFDHISACNEIKDYFDIPIMAGKEELELLNSGVLNESIKIGRRKIEIIADVALEDNEIIQVGEESLRTIFTPGHTSGSVCYYDEKNKIMFVGDTLFYESIGRTDFPTGSSNNLKNSVINKLFVLSKDIELYPGHGPKTSIEHEKNNNPYIYNI